MTAERSAIEARLCANELRIEQLARLLMPRNRLLYHDAVHRSLVVAIDGMVIRFPDSEVAHASSYVLNDDFDRGMQQVLHRLLRPGMTFVDVGASVGVLTSLAARLVGGKGRVYAFEPIESLAPFIRANVSINAPTTWLHLASAAVGQAPGWTALQLFEGDSRISTLFAYPEGSLPGVVHRRVTVPVVCLDDVIEVGAAVDVVKIDAEGAEKEILWGLQRIASDNPSLQIIVEWSAEHFARAGHTVDEIQQFLTAHNFSFCGINPLSGADIEADPKTFIGNARLFRA